MRNQTIESKRRPSAQPRLGPVLRAAILLFFGALLFAFFFQGDETPPADRALTEAVKRGDLVAARAAIAAGANPGHTDAIGSTRLHTVAWRGDLPMARLLIEHGAPVNHADRHSGETPLHSAARGDNADMIRYLLSAGADPDAQLRTQLEQCEGTIYPPGAKPADIARQSGFTAVERALRTAP